MMQVWNLYFRQSRVYAKIDTHSAALLPEERNNRETWECLKCGTLLRLIKFRSRYRIVAGKPDMSSNFI